MTDFMDKLKNLKTEASAELKIIDMQISELQEKRKQIVSVSKSITPGNKGTKRKSIEPANKGVTTKRGRGRPKKAK